MKVAFIARSTLLNVVGGDTTQVLQTAGHLRHLGVEVDLRLAHDSIEYDKYDLLHFFNLTRPADILYHINRTKKPFVLSPILVDYSDADRKYSKGIRKYISGMLNPSQTEYVKTIGRWLMGKDRLRSVEYLLKGQRNSIRKILSRTSIVLPASATEMAELRRSAPSSLFHTVPLGVDETLFRTENNLNKDENLVICVARIESIKNQLNLIKALNNTRYKLYLIGNPAPNQAKYFQQCRRIAADNITFLGHRPQRELVKYYQRAKVHVLPSWFENCGLSSLEAASLGCNVVIGNRGFASDYFGNDAFYCDPSSPSSIHTAIESAAASSCKPALAQRIKSNYTWKLTAQKTLEAYRTII